MLTPESRLADFPVLRGMTYLNTAAEGIPPGCVRDALEQYYRDKLLGMDGRQRHQQHWQSLRERAGRLFGLSADEIGICSCASEAFNLAALALQAAEGDEVVINDLDFPAGATPWLQPSYPAEVRLWRSREGAMRTEDLVGLLNARTRLVVLSLVSFFNGYTVDLPAVIDAVRRHSSALIAVDVTQAAGRVPLDLSGVDLVVSSTHKWILGTHGGGLVGVPSHRAREWTVPAGGWFHLENPFDEHRFERAVSKPGAAGFSVGMPNYPAVYAVNAALGYILNVGVAAIETHARPLMQSCLEELRKLPVEMLTPDKPGSMAGILAFRHPRADQIAAHLHERDIHIMCHAGRLRVAVHGYNTSQDVEKFLSNLQEALNHA